MSSLGPSGLVLGLALTGQVWAGAPSRGVEAAMHAAGPPSVSVAGPRQERAGEAVARLQAPLRATRTPGWSREQLDLGAWALELEGQERAIARILAEGRIPALGDEPEQTLSEVQLQLLLEACLQRPGLGRRVRAVAPEPRTVQGSFHLEVAAADLRGALAVLEGVSEGDDGRWARRGLAYALDQTAEDDPRATLLTAVRSLEGAPLRWVLEAIADRGRPLDGDLLAQIAAEDSAPLAVLVPSLQRCPRGLDLESRRAAVMALEGLAAAEDARGLELALAGLARLRAGEGVAARALESRDPRIRASGERWCRAVGAPTSRAGLEAWVEGEQTWLDRLGEVRDLLRSPDASRQLAGLGVAAARGWNQEVWGTLVAGHLRPADPRVARRQLEVLVRLEAAARIEVARGILRQGPAALVPAAQEILERAGLGAEVPTLSRGS